MKKIWYLVFFIIIGFSLNKNVWAQSSCPQDDPCNSLSDVFDKVTCYTNIVNICSTQRESMTSQVIYLTTKVELTNAKIQSFKEKIGQLISEIDELTSKIDNLENSLTKISSLFLDRIRASYKYTGVSYFNLLFTSKGFSELINRYKYVQTVQAHDRRLLFQLQNSKINYQEQKIIREEKKKELNDLQKQLEKEESVLVKQKKEKELFLQITKNSESIYKQNLSAAKREASEIQKAASILSQAGISRKVSRGDIIGIMGSTGFSTGPHLHFAVYNLREGDLNKFNFEVGYENPFNYLSSKETSFVPNSCDDVGNKTTKSIGGGSWEWPMSNPVITQCFGHTPFSAAYYSSGIHNGVDMYDDVNTLVKAADSGSAYTYRGGQEKGNGVFIFHDNGKMTLYWHLQ